VPATQPTIIDRLESEWDELVRRGSADQALERWRRHSPALDFASAGDLVNALADRTLDPVTCNEILAALVELAPSDQLAARLLLHRFLPYLRALVTDHAPFDAEEWVGLLVATAYEVICSYAAEDWPSYFPANLAREIRRRALGTLADRRRCERELSARIEVIAAEAAAEGHDPFTAVDLEDFLAWAVRRRLVDQRAVDLVLQTRIGGMTVAALAAAGRECADTLRQRRWRAERRLALALVSVA
jgi:hypothetical protein